MFRRGVVRRGLHYLIVDGYTQSGRAGLRAGGASTAGELYEKMLRLTTAQLTKEPVACATIFPADADFHSPPSNLADFDAVLWTGCSLSVTDSQQPQVANQIQLAQHCFQYGIPQFGSCWAAQIGIVAAGGVVSQNPMGREMGLARKITLTNEGRSHPMFTGRRTTFDAFTSHEDEITHLSKNSLNLASNNFTSVQAVAISHLNGEFWAVQYHPEYDLHELARLTFCRTEKLIRLGFFADEDAVNSYVEDLQILHKNPERSDLAWRYGFDEDILDQNIRYTEVQNFIKHMALPYAERANAAESTSNSEKFLEQVRL